MFDDILWVGIDDTDSLMGGCTTHILFKLVQRLEAMGYRAIRPSLVRLNPNVPWKTRGNGALAVGVKMGRDGGSRGSQTPHGGADREMELADLGRIEDAARGEIDKLGMDGSDPGCVISRKRGPEWFYWNCVRGIVQKAEAQDVVDLIGAHVIVEGRGLIGALAAISWPATERTYELIAYRMADKWGSRRYVDANSARMIEINFPETFDSFDLENGVQRIAPNSPCPVLYGIRGVDPNVLKRAKDVVKAEDEDGWIIFESNQGTDDHLQKKTIWEIQDNESVITEGFLSQRPRRARGGHLFFEISDETGSIGCAAFEPTKGFRDYLASLVVGDRVRAWGGVKKGTINLEKIELLDLITVYDVVNPTCPQCGRKMGSMGSGSGYRCTCGFKVAEDGAKTIKRERAELGLYEVPVRARKHLSKPVKLMPKNLYSSCLSIR